MRDMKSLSQGTNQNRATAWDTCNRLTLALVLAFSNFFLLLGRGCLFGYQTVSQHMRHALWLMKGIFFPPLLGKIQCISKISLLTSTLWEAVRLITGIKGIYLVLCLNEIWSDTSSKHFISFNIHWAEIELSESRDLKGKKPQSWKQSKEHWSWCHDSRPRSVTNHVTMGMSHNLRGPQFSHCCVPREFC